MPFCAPEMQDNFTALQHSGAGWGSLLKTAGKAINKAAKAGRRIGSKAKKISKTVKKVAKQGKKAMKMVKGVTNSIKNNKAVKAGKILLQSTVIPKAKPKKKKKPTQQTTKTSISKVIRELPTSSKEIIKSTVKDPTMSAARKSQIIQKEVATGMSTIKRPVNRVVNRQGYRPATGQTIRQYSGKYF